MYARLTFAKTLPEQFDRLRKIYNEEIVPAVRQQKGFMNIILLEPTDKAEDFISMTQWENKEFADQYEASGLYKELVGKLKDLLVKEPVLKTYAFEKVGEEIPAMYK